MQASEALANSATSTSPSTSSRPHRRCLRSWRVIEIALDALVGQGFFLMNKGFVGKLVVVLDAKWDAFGALHTH